MTPIEFDGQNVVFGEGQPEYKPLPARVGAEPEREVVTCWQLSEAELEAVKATGKVWLRQLTFGTDLQPVNLTVNPSDFGL